ncbi:MAG: ATP-binding protein [Sulfitobacter sp.]
MSFTWLKHYMPRGLYGRAALILLLPVVFLQLVVTVLFITRHFEAVTHQMTDAVARELDLVLWVANAAPSQAAIAAEVDAKLAQLDMTIEPVQPGNVPTGILRDWSDFSGRVILASLPRQLPQVKSVDLTVRGRVHVYADTRHGPVRIDFDRVRISAKNPHQLLVYTIILGGLVTVIAILYMRNQLRPITRLARAADAFGRGRHLPYTPSGAIEVRAAGAAFVDMRNRIERQIEQRMLMLSGISHDLRTPLTRMRLSLALLGDEDREPLERDVDEVQKMLDEFLNFVEGASEGEPEPVDPRLLLNDIVMDAKRSGHAVELLDIEGEGNGTVMLNKTAIRRAVDNLINNAVRYGSRAELSVLFTDKTLRVRVEDDGPGIPEERRTEAVRPFTRLDAARNLNKGGSVGLGLAIATDIARAHGGVLRLGRSEKLGGLQADIVIGR